MCQIYDYIYAKAQQIKTQFFAIICLFFPYKFIFRVCEFGVKVKVSIEFQLIEFFNVAAEKNCLSFSFMDEIKEGMVDFQTWWNSCR